MMGTKSMAYAYNYMLVALRLLLAAALRLGAVALDASSLNPQAGAYRADVEATLAQHVVGQA